MGCFKNVFKNQIASNIKTLTKASLYKIDSVCLKHNPQGQKQEFNLHGKSKRWRKLQNSSLEEYKHWAVLKNMETTNFKEILSKLMYICI